MILKRIKTENFRLHADTEVVIPEGVTGIIGTNESGKSTLATEAVLWAFYGGKYIRGTMEGLRWNRAPARHTAKVFVHFEVGGIDYRVERTESGAKLYNLTTGEIIADGTAPTNAYIPTLIGMGHDEFITSYLVKQKDVSRIASMGGVERQAFIRKVMGVGRLDAALVSCRKKKSDLSKELGGLKEGLGDREPLQEELDAATAALAEAETAHEQAQAVLVKTMEDHEAQEAKYLALDAQRLQVEQLQQEREAACKAQVAAGSAIEELKIKLAKIAQARPRVQEADEKLADLPKHRQAKAELEEEQRQRARKIELEERIETLTDEIAKLEEEISAQEEAIQAFDPAAYEEARVTLAKAESALQEAWDARKQAKAKKEAEAEQADRDAARLREKVAHLEGLGPDGACPTCTQTLGDNFGPVVGKFLDQIHLAEEMAKDARIDAGELEHAPDDELQLAIEKGEAEDELDRLGVLKAQATASQALRERARFNLAAITGNRINLQAEVDEIGDTTSEHVTLARVKAIVIALEALQADPALVADRALVAQLDETTNALTNQEADLEAAIRTIEDRERVIAGIGFVQSIYEAQKQAAAEAQNALQEARVALATTQEAQSHSTRRREAARKAVEAYDGRATRLHEVEADHLCHERAAARLADFRVAVAATIRPEMEELMSGFIQLLTDGRHEAVELSEDFSVTLYESGIPVEVVSGGTEDITALAMRLALSQMIAERAGHPLSLLILDEPFGSLDETRRANVITLIHRLRSVFRQVIVISHVAETKDAVDNVIELEFDEAAGKTRVMV